MNNVLMQTKLEVLEEIAKDFLMEEFGIELNIPIEINGRLSRSLGRFVCYPSRKKSVKIELSKRLLEFYDDDEVVDTLRHECVHYALFELGKPYSDTDMFFINTCNRLDVGLTETTSYKGLVHVYKCLGCQKEHESVRRFNPTSYRCKTCKQGFEYVSQKVWARTN